jgi:RimJ/RimL family protein N-acetyltransferase
VELALRTCVVRSWRADDVPSLVHHADNRLIWLNLRDGFPHPYTKADGQAFVRESRRMNPESNFAIDVGGSAVGGIGFHLQSDVERVSSEIGYWLGQALWGRGIATDAVVAVTRYAMERYDVTRMFALPYAHNVASCRVLEKAGYVLEARLRRSAIKDSRIIDQLQYAFIAPA